MSYRRNSHAGTLRRTDGSLGEALAAFLKTSGLSAGVRYPEVCRAWDDSVGLEFADRTRVSSFRHGVLEVEVDSSALRSEIMFYQRALLQTLRGKVKKPFITRLSFVVRPTERDND